MAKVFIPQVHLHKIRSAVNLSREHLRGVSEHGNTFDKLKTSSKINYICKSKANLTISPQAKI